MRYRIGVCWIFFIVLASQLDAGLRPWTEIRSPHFVVFTDSTASDGRRVAREFEQMRAVFANGFPNMRLETAAPLIIFAAHDEESMKALNPSQWKGKHVPKLAGYFSHHWEKTFAVIRLDQDVPGAYQVVYHEYVHSLMHANFRWLPQWLDEGLADYYGGSAFQDNKTYVGAPSLRMGRVRNRLLIPIERLIIQNPYVAYRGDEERIDTFYGESEALIHFLLFGEGMEQGKKFNEFFVQIERGQDQVKTFQAIFGDFKAVQRKFELYLRAFAFATYVVNDPPQIHQKEFAARTTDLAETEAALATFRIWSHDFSEAKNMIDAALHDAPNLAEAHDDNAFLLFAEGKDSEAAAEFAKAFELNDRDYLALYYKTMLSPSAHSDQDADQVALRENLARVLMLNRQFAPAYIELAKLFLKWGEIDNAASNARSAESFEPTRAGYHLLLARVLQRKGQTADAGKVAQYVVERWNGPDQDEARDFLESLPPGDRSAVTDVEKRDAEVQKTEGKIVQVSCKENGGIDSVALNREGQTVTYEATGGFAMGFSDTLWFGADHFTPCHHLEGMKAIVFSKPGNQKDPARRVVKLEIREELPPGPARKAASAPAPQEQTP